MKIKELPASELTVMKIIWDVKRPIQMEKSISWRLEQYGKDWKYQTVSTYLRSLVKRGFLDMEPKGRGFDYTPRISEDEYLRAAMGELAGFWGKQSLNYLASAISESGGLTEQDIQELERLIHAPND